LSLVWLYPFSSKLQMATLHNSEPTSSSGPAEGLTPEQEARVDGNDTPIEEVSEVTMRINLLGKLIIPPPLL
jgi:hypothetical protein